MEEAYQIIREHTGRDDLSFITTSKKSNVKGLIEYKITIGGLEDLKYGSKLIPKIENCLRGKLRIEDCYLEMENTGHISIVIMTDSLHKIVKSKGFRTLLGLEL